MRPNHETVDRMVDLCTELGLHNLIITNLRKMGGAIKMHGQLVISEEERLEAACKVAERVRKSEHCHVQFEAIPLLARLYINAKYGLNLYIGGGGCNAVTTKAYVQPDGTLFPCQDVAKEVGRLREREQISAEGLSSWDSERFAGISSSLEGMELYQNYTPCNTCPALGKVCTPCPLPGLKGKEVSHESCSFILRRAELDGIDLEPALQRLIDNSCGERVLRSPSFRRQFFTTDDVSGFLDSADARGEARSSLEELRVDGLAELSALLRSASAVASDTELQEVALTPPPELWIPLRFSESMCRRSTHLQHSEEADS